MAILNHRRYRWTPLTDAFIPGNKNRSSICILVRETCSTMKINLRVEERHTVLHRSRAHRRLFSEINAAFRRKRRRPSFFLFLFSNVDRTYRGGGGGIDWFFGSVVGIYSGIFRIKLADQTRKTASKGNSKRVLSRFLNIYS